VEPLIDRDLPQMPTPFTDTTSLEIIPLGATDILLPARKVPVKLVDDPSLVRSATDTNEPTIIAPVVDSESPKMLPRCIDNEPPIMPVPGKDEKHFPRQKTSHTSSFPAKVESPLTKKHDPILVVFAELKLLPK
jgi:hypothetical protein